MARASEVVSVIKPPKRVLGSDGAPVAGPPEPKASSEAQKPDSPKRPRMRRIVIDHPVIGRSYLPLPVPTLGRRLILEEAETVVMPA